MAQRLEDEPPERRPPIRWDDFLPQMLANTAGTLFAAIIVYLYAVLVGLVKANWRILAPILVGVGVAVARIIELRIEAYLAQSFRGGRVMRGVLYWLSGVPTIAMLMISSYILIRRELWWWLVFWVPTFGILLLNYRRHTISRFLRRQFRGEN